MSEKKIKVLIISPPFERIGGVNNYVRVLMNNNTSNEIQIKHFPLGISGQNYNSGLMYYLSPLPWLQVFKFKQVLKKYKPDLIHLNPSLMSIFLLLRMFIFLRISKNNNISVLLFMRGWRKSISHYFSSKGLLSNFFHQFFSMADLILVLAEDFKKELVYLGISPEKVRITTTMVEARKYNIERGEFSPPFQILHASHLRKEKGIYELLSAVPIVLNKYPNTRFVFLGAVEQIRFENKIKEMNLGQNVFSLGYKLGKDKIDIYKNSDIFVLPTYSEGFPNVFCEAMASGLPFVGTPVGGLKDILEDRKQGFIIRSMPPDPEEIAQRIIELIGNPELMKRISDNNVNEALSKYDAVVVSEGIIRIYKEICGSRFKN